MDNENVYRIARLKTKEYGDSYSSAEKVAVLNYMDKAKVLDVENGKADPEPKFVKWMAENYNAPELVNYYCTHQCPLGDRRAEIKKGSLEELSWHLLSGVQFLDDLQKKLFAITADGDVSESEKAEFLTIIDSLRKLAGLGESLEVWAKKREII